MAESKADEIYLFILKNIFVEGSNRKSWLILFGAKVPRFIDAELKNQEILGLQLATEIERYPEISVVARY